MFTYLAFNVLKHIGTILSTFTVDCLKNLPLALVFLRCSLSWQLLTISFRSAIPTHDDFLHSFFHGYCPNMAQNFQSATKLVQTILYCGLIQRYICSHACSPLPQRIGNILCRYWTTALTDTVSTFHLSDRSAISITCKKKLKMF